MPIRILSIQARTTQIAEMLQALPALHLRNSQFLLVVVKNNILHGCSPYSFPHNIDIQDTS